MEQGLNKSDSDIPASRPPAHVHLMGICGTGMASLAGMFYESGYRVTGSDQAVYPPMSDFLRGLGIKVMEGYSPSNLTPRPDMVVIGNVIRKANLEAIEVERLGIPFTSMPAALYRYFVGEKSRVVVAGTHGKTTVSAMIAWILFQSELDPGFMIGGLPRNFERNYRLGKGPFFVIEGDEYDTAYFDKRPKFLHYFPKIAVMTSCEFDHADIYKDLEQIQNQFRGLARLIPGDGHLIANTDDPHVRAVLAGSKIPIETYGLDGRTDWTATDLEDRPEGIQLTVSHRRRIAASGTLPVVGYHNGLNALAAIAATSTMGVTPQAAIEALGSFRGVKRRQEVLGEPAGVLVIDDYAHHPTAVRVTCSGVRDRFPGRRLIAVFEPRTNTSRRAVFQDLYVPAFVSADLILVREPRDAEKLPEADRFSSEKLARDLRSIGKTALAFEDTDKLLEFLLKGLQEGDIVLIMSNGDFDGLKDHLLEALKELEK